MYCLSDEGSRKAEAGRDHLLSSWQCCKVHNAPSSSFSKLATWCPTLQAGALSRLIDCTCRKLFASSSGSPWVRID